MDKTFSRKIETLFALFDEIETDKNNAFLEISKHDKELSIMYHHIEGIKLGHIAESHKLLKELQTLLIRRRDAKGNAQILQVVCDNLKTKIDYTKSSFDEAIKKHIKVEEEVKERAKIRKKDDL